MKLTSILLLAASSAANDAAPNSHKKITKTPPKKKLKLRRLDAAADDEKMSMDDVDEKIWGYPPSPAPPAPCGVPDAKECDGRQYYKILTATDLDPTDGRTQVPWIEFYDATPEKCVMAPIHSNSEWNELYAEANALLSGSEVGNLNLWVGITKPALAVGTGAGSTSGWLNLDGTDAHVYSAGQWGTNEPNNSPPYQTKAHMWFSSAAGQGGKLRDLNPNGNSGPDVMAAIYKCCDPVAITFPSCAA